MQKKKVEYAQAIRLRREGYTYREILEKIPVAKSTLSLWLRSVGLAKAQAQRLTEKRIKAGRRGGQSRRIAREQEVRHFLGTGLKDVGRLSKRELWLIGIALYWAEGSKQHAHLPSTGILFGNSDVHMITVFMRWLEIMGISNDDIYFELYIHENRKREKRAFREWWAHTLEVDVARIDRIYWKRNTVLTNRTNTGDLYHGLLRIKVRSSTVLNRRINGWIAGIVASLGDRLMVGRLPLKQ